MVIPSKKSNFLSQILENNMPVALNTTDFLNICWLQTELSIILIQFFGVYAYLRVYGNSVGQSKVKISKLSKWAEIENTKPPDPPDIKNAPFVNFDP